MPQRYGNNPLAGRITRYRRTLRLGIHAGQADGLPARSLETAMEFVKEHALGDGAEALVPCWLLTYPLAFVSVKR